MYTVKREQISQSVEKYWILRKNERLTYKNALQLLRDEREFRDIFIEVMRQSTFKAYLWETPAFSSVEDQPFEFVLIHNASLENFTPNSSSFKEHFTKSDKTIVCKNLRKDALLIIPYPREKDQNCYTHMANFMRFAPDDQIHELLQQTAISVLDYDTFLPIWLSTSGLAVPWLHVRVDTKPKYYRYQPYK